MSYLGCYSKTLALAIIAVIFSLISYAQQAPLTFHYLMDDFPELDPYAASIHQDSRGYMWFGGQKKINRYDGIRLKTYMKKDLWDADEYYSWNEFAVFLNDSYHNMWMTIGGALFYYDSISNQFTRIYFDSTNIKVRKKYQFYALMEDNDQNLWATTDAGFVIRISLKNLIDPIISANNMKKVPISGDKFDVIYVYPDDPKKSQNVLISYIMQDRYNNIWIGCFSGNENYMSVGRYIPDGLAFPGYFVDYFASNQDLDRLSFQFFADAYETLWIYARPNLINFSSSSNKKIYSDSVIVLGIDTLYYYPFLKNKNVSFEPDISISPPLNVEWFEKLAADKNGFWTRGGQGISRYILPTDNSTGSSLECIFSNNLLFDKNGMRGWDQVIYKSNEDLLWLGPWTYRPYGPSFIDLKSLYQFKKFQPKPPADNWMPLDDIYGIYVDPWENIWLSLKQDNSVYVVDKNFNFKEKLQLIPDCCLWYTKLWGNGKFLIISGGFVIDLEKFNKGLRSSDYLSKIGKNNFSLHLHKVMAKEGRRELEINWWSGVFHDKNNILWLSEKSGIYYFDLNSQQKALNTDAHSLKFEHLKISPQFEDSLVFNEDWNIIPGNSDNLYILKAWELIEIDIVRKKYWNYNLTDSTLNRPFKKNEWLIGKTIDGMDHVWLTSEQKTYQIIINEHKLDSINEFSVNDGFPVSPITCITDHNGNVWIYGEHEGLFLYDIRKKIVHKYSGAGVIKEWLTFGRFRDLKNQIYMAAGDGITVFHPDSIRDNPFVPPVHITDIKILHESIYDANDPTLFSSLRNSKKLVVPHHRNMLTIEFASLSFTQPLRNLYAYCLTGVDKDWVYTDARHAQATYTGLAPGSYTFSVKGSNNDGIWNEAGTTLDITILPPWWLTAWMKGIYLLIFGGAVWGFVYLRTLRQKRKLQEVQRINAKLRQIDQLKDQFLSNTSHELRTPLLGIIGIAESLLEGIAGPLTAKLKENLRIITGSGKRLSNLINDILDFSKLRTHELILHPQPVDMFSAAEVVISLLKSFIQRKSLTVINTISKDLPLVEADENRIQQILFNLLGNALKFTEKGSISLSASVANGRLAVTVSDTGIGIPEDKFDVIFRPFEQAEGSISREYSGTGIGLSITRQLVELHGGEVRVQSVQGQGSHFTFTLPLSSISRTEFEASPPAGEILSGILSEEAPDSTPAPAALRKTASAFPEELIHILVVDDEPVNLQVLQNYLGLEGYRVTLANSGFEALACLVKEEKFDLIILDIMMPKLSGFEVCKKIREVYMSTELPVMIVTAKNRITDLVEGFNVGANDYLTKPFSREELLSRIRTHLNLHRINRATGRFVPYEFLRSIGRESIIEAQVGDQAHKVVSVLFLDIREYASLSESMSPEDNFRFINSLVGKIGPAIRDNNGFVNQYIGDAVMAIFPHKADQSLKGAIQIQKIISDYNLYRKSRKRRPIQIGIGIHTGHLIMGIIGDENRSETATIADTVNIASRIEGLTRHYGVRILVTEECMQHLELHADYHFRYMGEVIVKGKQYPTRLYECFDGDEVETIDLKLKTKEEFEKGFRCFYAREFPEASVVFNKIVKKNSQDFPAAYFYKRSIQFAMTGVPEDWSGVEKLTEK